MNTAIDLGRGGSYCKMCHRNELGTTHNNGKKLNAKGKKKIGNISRQGGPQPLCHEHICG